MFAAEGVENLELLDTLDTFGNGAQAVGARHGDDRGDDGLAFRELSQLIDKGAIDLEAVDRELAEVAERVACHGEIVDSDADALSAQCFQSVAEVLQVVVHGTFGDFDIDVGGIDRVARLLEEVCDEPFAVEFDGRDVDSDSQGRKAEGMPVPEVVCGLGENPFSDGDDESSPLEDR